MSRPRRPGPLRWLGYAVTGRLPWDYREWVLEDLTCRTWPLRHLARLLVIVLPVAAALLLVLPGPLGVRLAAVSIGSIIGLSYTFVFLEESTDRRATRFGWPHGTPAEVRAFRARLRDLDERGPGPIPR
jgi:hypothetical protein